MAQQERCCEMLFMNLQRTNKVRILLTEDRQSKNITYRGQTEQAND